MSCDRGPQRPHGPCPARDTQSKARESVASRAFPFAPPLPRRRTGAPGKKHAVSCSQTCADTRARRLFLRWCSAAGKGRACADTRARRLFSRRCSAAGKGRAYADTRARHLFLRWCSAAGKGRACAGAQVRACFCAGALPRARAVPALAHGYAPVSVLVRKAGAAQICGRAPVRAFSPHPAQKRKYHCCTKGKAPASGKNGRWLRSRPRWAAAHLRPAALPSSHFGSLAGHRVFRVYQCRLARQTKHPGWRPSTRTTWPGGIQAAKNRLALCTAMVVNPCAVW